MKELAPDVRILDGFPPDTINVYLLGDIPVDAGTLLARRPVLRR